MAPETMSRHEPQDVYTATLAPLEMPADARTLVLQVLTTSGPAPDALVVPLVDEGYDAAWTKVCRVFPLLHLFYLDVCGCSLEICFKENSSLMQLASR